MQEIYFYYVDSDNSLKFLHTETKTTSTQWHLKYADIGTFEFNTDIYNDIVQYVLPQAHSDIIAVQGNKSAWIHAETDIIGDDINFTIMGKTLNFMLNWRIVKPFTVTDTIENIIRDLIADSFMTVGNNYMANFSMSAVIGGTSSTTYTIEDDDKPKLLFDVVRELCAIDNLGFSIDIVNEQFEFKLYRGLDKTQSQIDRPAVVLAEDLKTLRNSEYIFMQDNYCSCGYYPLKDEEADIITWTEIIKDAKIGFFRRESLLSENELTKATEELKKLKSTETINGDAVLKYGIDYSLGDIITIQRKIGNTIIIKNMRVSGVDIAYEPNNDSENPILEEVNYGG